MGTPFDILAGRDADGGGVRLDGSARGLGCLAVVLAAWGASGCPPVMAPPHPVRGMVPQKCRT